MIAPALTTPFQVAVETLRLRGIVLRQLPGCVSAWNIDPINWGIGVEN